MPTPTTEQVTESNRRRMERDGTVMVRPSPRFVDPEQEEEARAAINAGTATIAANFQPRRRRSRARRR